MLHLPRDSERSPECAKGRDQVPAPAPNLPSGRRVRYRVRVGAGGGGDRGQGQAELEAGAGAAEGGVTDDQLPVLGAGQLAGNVEAGADPAGPPGGAGVELGEALEDALAVGRLDPGAGVLDGQHGPGAVAGRLQADRAVVRSEED